MMHAHALPTQTKFIAAFLVLAVLMPVFAPLTAEAIFTQQGREMISEAQNGTGQNGAAGNGNPSANAAADGNVAKAADGSKNASDTSGGFANWLLGASITVVGKFFAWGGEIILSIESNFVAISAKVFSFTMGMTLDGQILNAPAVKKGWNITRDVANMFFIFILLTIAIATILNIESYGAKQLLPKVIIAALLINFSFAIAKVPIDAANVLAFTFYDNIGTQQDETLAATHLRAQKDIGAAITNIINPQRIYEPGKSSSPENQISDDSPTTKLFAVIFSIVLGIALLAVLIYVFITGVIIFIARIVALWILLILAPLAVVAAILPNLKTYWNEWLKSLLNYAIVAPIFIFFIYLTLNIAQDDFINSIFNFSVATNEGLSVTGGGLSSFAASEIRYIAQYFILIAFLLAAVKAAKKLGVVGADAIEKAGMSVYKGALSLAGGMAIGAVAGSAKAGGRLVRRHATAPLAKKIGESESKTARFAKSIPFVQRHVLQPHIAAQKAAVEEKKKELEHLAPQQLKSRFSRLGTNHDERAAILSTLAEKGDLKPEGDFTTERMASTLGVMNRQGIKTSNITRLNPALAAIGKEGDEAFEAMKKAAAGLKGEDISKLGDEVRTNPDAMKAIAATMTQNTFRGFIDSGGKLDDTNSLLNALVSQMEKIAGGNKTRSAVRDGFRREGNTAMANYVERSAAATTVLGFQDDIKKKSK